MNESEPGGAAFYNEPPRYRKIITKFFVFQKTWQILMLDNFMKQNHYFESKPVQFFIISVSHLFESLYYIDQSLCSWLFTTHPPWFVYIQTTLEASITKDKAKMTGTPSICAVVLWYIHISIVYSEKKITLYNHSWPFFGHNHTHN